MYFVINCARKTPSVLAGYAALYWSQKLKRLALTFHVFNFKGNLVVATRATHPVRPASAHRRWIVPPVSKVRILTVHYHCRLEHDWNTANMHIFTLRVYVCVISQGISWTWRVLV